MPRDRSKVAEKAPAVSGSPLLLHPHAVFSLAQLCQALGVRPRTLPREVREGRLKVCKRAGRYYFFGQDVADWLRGGQLKKDGGSAATDTRRVAHDEEL
jgi:hypothetical protein